METIEEINAALDARDANIAKLIEESNGKAGEELANIKNALEVQATEGLKLRASLIELTQNVMDRLGNAGKAAAVAGFAASAIASPAFAGVMDGSQQKARYEASGSWHTSGAIIGSGTTGEGNGGVLLTPDYRPGLIQQPDMPLVIRDLLTPGQTDKQVISYFRETGFTNAAEFVTEGGQKPYSDAEFEQVDANVRTIAHLIKATNQILADVPMLRSYIDFRLRWGVRERENAALLNGSGTGQSIEGLNTVATAYDTSWNEVGDTMIDTLSHAYTQASLAYYPVDYTILHPRDWERINLLKDNEARYIWANPGSVLGPTIWGKRVVATAAQDEGTFTVGSSMASQIFDREGIAVEIATENDKDFEFNLVTLRGEERLAVAHYRPEAIRVGEFPQT